MKGEQKQGNNIQGGYSNRSTIYRYNMKGEQKQGNNIHGG